MDFSNRVFKNKVSKKNRPPLDADMLKYLHDYAAELEIDVEELALLLHTQEIYLFEDIEDILGIDPIEPIEDDL